MNEILYLNMLYDLYGELLTEKQQHYFEDYYFHNLSFSEIAENYGVSRNAIFKQLHIATDKLKEYEAILHLYDKKERLERALTFSSLKQVREELENLF